jgi:hypothetical protein
MWRIRWADEALGVEALEAAAPVADRLEAGGDPQEAPAERAAAAAAAGVLGLELELDLELAEIRVREGEQAARRRRT